MKLIRRTSICQTLMRGIFLASIVLSFGSCVVVAETIKVAVAPSLAQEPGQKTLQNIAEAPKVVEAPAKEAGDAGPPPVKAEDIISKPEPQHVEREQPRHRAERPHYRRIAHGYGGRVCAFSMPVPYIGGITIRGRC